jgi:hypothetical protein
MVRLTGRHVESEAFVGKHFVEPATGKVHRIYTYNRKPCRREVLNSRLAEQLAGYALIEKDLRSAAIWFKEIERLTDVDRDARRYVNSPNRETYNIVKGLFVAALTFYGKCFTKCEGRPVKLERSQLDEQFRESHDECMAYRHNFAAHSGAKKLEQVTVALVTPVKQGKRPAFQLFKELFQPDFIWSEEEDGSLTQLVEHVRSIAEQKMHKLNDKIIEEEVLPKLSGRVLGLGQHLA